MDYRVWAILSAVFAGLTALLSKKGIEGVPPNLALVVRVAFIFVFVALLAGVTRQFGWRELNRDNWTYLGLSALATGASWACYFRALEGGPISKVAPIDKLSFVIAVALGFVFLKEKVTPTLLGGVALIVSGVLLTLK
jgi:transporter family protein